MTVWDTLRCPHCGGRIEAEGGHLACRGCGPLGSLDGQVARFARRAPATPEGRRQHLRALLAHADATLHPLRGRWSPLRWYADRRLEDYYARCLTDKDLAEEFRRHYLPPALQRTAGSALDFGCGRGRVVALMGQLGFQVVGLDTTPHPYWKRVRTGRFVVWEGPGLPFESGAFDLVTHFGVLMYFADPAAHLREVSRVLRPGGYVSLQVTNRHCLRNRWAGRFGDAEVFRLYTRDELLDLLGGCGFLVERVEAEAFYAPVFPLFVNFVRRVLLARRLDLFDRDSLCVRLTPPASRGVLHTIARKG